MTPFFFFFYEGMIRLEKVEVATTSNRGIGGKSNSKASTAERAESVFGQPSSRTLLRRVNVPRFSNRCEYTTPAGIEWDPDKEVIEIVLKRSVHVNRHLFFEILRCLPSYQDAVLCESSCWFYSNFVYIPLLETMEIWRWSRFREIR